MDLLIENFGNNLVGLLVLWPLFIPIFAFIGFLLIFSDFFLLRWWIKNKVLEQISSHKIFFISILGRFISITFIVAFFAILWFSFEILSVLYDSAFPSLFHSFEDTLMFKGLSFIFILISVSLFYFMFFFLFKPFFENNYQFKKIPIFVSLPFSFIFILLLIFASPFLSVFSWIWFISSISEAFIIKGIFKKDRFYASFFINSVFFILIFLLIIFLSLFPIIQSPSF